MEDWFSKAIAGVLGIVGAGSWARWLISNRDKRMDKIESAHNDWVAKIAQTYMPAEQIKAEFNRIDERLDDVRGDVKEGFGDMKAQFQRLYDKIDGKADK